MKLTMITEDGTETESSSWVMHPEVAESLRNLFLSLKYRRTLLSPARIRAALKRLPGSVVKKHRRLPVFDLASSTNSAWVYTRF